MKLSKALLLHEGWVKPNDVNYTPVSEYLLEKVFRFGEGNFLRAFVDWMFTKLIQKNLFDGKIVVVQPIPEGKIDEINNQDGLSTVILRGYKGGKFVEEKEIITSISRGINPYTQWKDFIKCAENPNIKYIISNTTEAGIFFDKNDSFDYEPPLSFPGKITAYLYSRYIYFNGAKDKGMIILPCELIDRNGDNLKCIVLRLAQKWNLPYEFWLWVQNSNTFLNTLVDRTVAGYPKDEICEITRMLGYEDDLVNVAEIFHFWIIEGPKHLSEELPFHKIGLKVKWVEDISPYRFPHIKWCTYFYGTRCLSLWIGYCGTDV